jgi:hypothetical protein
MYLSSQGVSFLGLTAKKYTAGEISSDTLRAVQEKLESFNQTSAGFANNTVALENLKSVNAKAYCVVDGQKVEINEKSWDRGGTLEGKVPLEEGISSGLYHIEQPTDAKSNIEEEKEDLDSLLAQLKRQVEADAASLAVPTPKDPFSKDSAIPNKPKNKIDAGSSFKFIS